ARSRCARPRSLAPQARRTRHAPLSQRLRAARAAADRWQRFPSRNAGRHLAGRPQDSGGSRRRAAPPRHVSPGFTHERRRSATRDRVEIALMAALCVALGYALASVPNVELISAATFTCGARAGARRGAVVGALAEALFAGFNPQGISPPPLYAAQILGFALLGAAGGLRRARPAAGCGRWWRAARGRCASSPRRRVVSRSRWSTTCSPTSRCG